MFTLCNIWLHFAIYCNLKQHFEAICNILQHCARFLQIFCNILQIFLQHFANFLQHFHKKVLKVNYLQHLQFLANFATILQLFCNSFANVFANIFAIFFCNFFCKILQLFCYKGTKLTICIICNISQYFSSFLQQFLQ